jgi:hypothetical protein
MDDEREATLFIGEVARAQSSFVDACKAVWRQGPLVRAKCSILTRDHTYRAAQLESMRREDEEEMSARRR